MKFINKHARSAARLFLTGFAMGSADIVPGVSGGTIAFIFGVYEELIYSIKKLSGETLRLALKFDIKKTFMSVPFSFLVPLGIGVMTAFLTLASLLSHLLETSPVYVWSFFFGLIVASILIVRKRVVTWDHHDVAAFFFGALVAFVLVGIVPVQTPATIPAFLIAGSVAIVAMIMPGVSGSFILLMMGKYEQVLNAVVERDIVTLGSVAVGAVIGLAVFSRILSWLFEKHHDLAVAILTGFMLGSLRKIWPWKEVIETRVNSHGVVVPLVEANILPTINGEFWLAIAIAVAGALILTYLEKMNATKEHMEDVEDKNLVKKHKKALKSQKWERV